jgi:hypothetical protein
MQQQFKSWHCAMPNVFLISIHDKLALLFIWCGVDEGEGLKLNEQLSKSYDYIHFIILPITYSCRQWGLV